MTGHVEVHAAREPGDEELTNLAAVSALRHVHRVHMLPPDDMPAGSPSSP